MQTGGDAATGSWLLIILMTFSFVFILSAYLVAPANASVYDATTRKVTKKKVKPSAASRVLFGIAMAFNAVCIIISIYVLRAS